MNDDNLKPKPPGFFHLLKTTMAAAVGVQSNKNRIEDFSQKSVLPYIVAGVVFTIMFVLILVAVVSIVLKQVNAA